MHVGPIGGPSRMIGVRVCGGVVWRGLCRALGSLPHSWWRKVSPPLALWQESGQILRDYQGK